MIKRKHVILFFYILLSVINGKTQPAFLGTWPVSYPLAYLHFYDNGIIQVDTTGIVSTTYAQIFSSAIISKENRLMFFSNGCKVVDTLASVIQNGDSLVENEYYKSWGSTGTLTTQGVIALPRDADTWWIFNMSFSDSAQIYGTPLSPDRLYGAIVDIKANNGAGKVLQKKIPVYRGVMGDCRMTAVRHANGRDWWLVNHGWNNNCFNKWLVTPDSIYSPVVDCVGTLHQEIDWYGMAKFSEDGTKYAMGSTNGLVNILDFDRCSGKFTNLRTINYYPVSPWSSTGISPVHGLCFSPSGRYLYLSRSVYLSQYDTWADSIEATRVDIAVKDSTYQNPEPLFTMALTPHDKILVANKQGLPGAYHIIHSPDSAGATCQFEKEGLPIVGSYTNFSLPNLVNLKLGADSTSLCDTIVLSPPTPEGGLHTVHVFPNPATERVAIEVNNNRYFTGTLTIVNQLGQTVYENKQYDGATAIKVSGWPAGVYYYHLKNKGHEQSGKVVVGR